MRIFPTRLFHTDLYEPRGRRFGGMLTEMGIRALRIDRFFFSGGGYDSKRGIGEPNPEEARLKAMIMVHANWKCALIDHTKLGKSTDHFFVTPSQIDLLICNAAGAEFFGNPSVQGQAFEILPHSFGGGSPGNEAG